MIEKYEVIKCSVSGSESSEHCVTDPDSVVLAQFGEDENECRRAKILCAKLNRLAALEAVCREIVESAPQSEDELEQMYEFYVNGGLQKEAGHVRYGEEVKKYIIAQKLKAVLEEA